VETLLIHIQDCVDYSEAVGITISEVQKIITDYVKIFSTGNFHSACRRWNKRNPQDQTWNNFKINFATAYRQHKQMQVETTAASRYTNASVAEPADDDISESSHCCRCQPDHNHSSRTRYCCHFE
jgi:hypothetical protein